MANIAALLQQLQGGNQQADPLAQLLQSRGAPAAPFSSFTKPVQLPNSIQQQAQQQDMSSDFYGQLNAISDSVAEQRQAAEDAIAQNAQKAHDDALMRKIKAMIPQGTPYSGGSGSGGNSPAVALPSGFGGGYSKPKNNLPILPDIGKGYPNTAPPQSAHDRMCSARPDLC